jgi:peroxiredoxin
MAGQIPDEVLGAFVAEQAGLDTRGIPTGIAEPGDTLGDFDLLDVHGAPTTVSTALGERTAVMVLYRGAWCPYCNLALRAYQDDLAPTLADKGIALVAISPQKPDGSLSAQEKNELTFTVLSDPGNKIANRLGVMTMCIPTTPRAPRPATFWPPCTPCPDPSGGPAVAQHKRGTAPPPHTSSPSATQRVNLVAISDPESKYSSVS